MESFSLERVQINLASSSRPVLSRGHEGVVREKSTSVGEVAVKEYRVVDSLRRELNIIRHYFGKPSKRFGFFSLPLNAQSARARLEMEYARQLGDVIDVMNTCGPPSLAVRRVVAVSCLLACECLDSMKLCHTDIKLENILVCRDGSIKLCDMGSCVPYGGRVVVQSEMASPFQLNSSVATLDGMLWCVGCAVYELATGRIPYPYKAVVRGDMAAIDWDKISLKINTNLTEREKPLVRRLLLVPPGARGARGRSPFEDLWSLSWFWTMDLDAIRHGGVAPRRHHRRLVMAPERALAYKRHAVVSPKPRGPDATMRLVAGVVCVAAACIGLARGEPTCTVSFPTRDQSGFETWKGTCFPTEGGTIQSCVSNEIMLVANSERYSTDENYFTYLEGCERDPSTAMHCCTRLDTDRKNGIQNIMVGLSANSTKLIQSAWPEAECPAEGSCEVHCVKGDLDRCANIASVLMHAEAGDVRLSSVVVNHKKNLLSEEDERLAQASVSGDEFVYLGASGFAIFIFGTLLVWWRRRKYKEAKEEYKRMIDENTESLTSRV